VPAVAKQLQPISIEKLFAGRTARAAGRQNSNSFQFRSTSLKANEDDTFNVDVVVTTETPCLRNVSPWDYLCGPNGEEITQYEEVLMCNPDAVDPEYLDAGMSVCDSHMTMLVSEVGYGDVIPDSVEYQNVDGVNQMTATLRLNGIAQELGIVDAVKNRTIKFLSPAYDILEAAWWIVEGSLPQLIVTRWKPTELSFVSVPADVKAQVRDRKGRQIRSRQQEHTMPAPAKTEVLPTAEEIAAAQAIVDAAAVRAKAAAAPVAPTAAEIAAAIESLRSKTAPTAEVPAPQAGERTVIPADNPEFALIMVGAKKLGPHVVEAVEGARLMGDSLQEIREEAREARRSRPQPQINSDQSFQLDDKGQVIPGSVKPGARSAGSFNAYEILQSIKEAESKNPGKRYR
jgi:hypothetical protein